MGRASLRALFIALVATFLFGASTLFAAPCEGRRGVLSSEADVFASVPKYATGVGWQGATRTHLSKGTQVYICQEQKTEFGFSTKTWAQIAYSEKGKFEFGWIQKENVADWQPRRGQNATGSRYALIAAVFAASPAADAEDEWNLAKLPKQAPSHSDSNTPAPESNATGAPLDDLVALYMPLFLAMLLGMTAKAAVDWLDASEKSILKEHLRNAVTAFLVSPIVFLGFLSAGQFSTSRQTFIVLCLLAFQNGFFWQTVLKRTHRPQDNEAVDAPKAARGAVGG